MVFGLEVGGRFHSQVLVLLRRLVTSPGPTPVDEPRKRWTALAALAALRAHAQSLLELAHQRRRRAAASGLDGLGPRLCSGRTKV